MHFDQTPDRPVPPHGNPRSGGQGPGPANPQPDYRGTSRPWPSDQDPPGPRPYRPRPGRPGPGDQETDNRGTGRPWPESGQAPYRRVPGDLRRRGLAGPGALRPTRPQDPWDADPRGPRFSGQEDPWSKDPWSTKANDPWSTEANDPWSAESRGPWVTEARGLQSAGPRDPRSAASRPDQPQPESRKRESSLKLTGSLLRARSMRKPVMVSGALGVVLVLAIGMVALAVTRGSSNGSAASASTQASNLTKASRTAPAPASPAAKASAKAKAKASAKPAPSHTANKTTAPSGTTAPAPSLLTVPSGWKLAFDPSFSGSQLDTATWSTCYDWATPSAGCTNNPSTEKEWYLPSQVQVSGGVLNLTAKQETTQGQPSSGAAQTYACRSGMISSKPGFNFTYGLISVTAKIPYGSGLWPALWLAATNDQWPPELDIMEHWYSEQDYKIYDHTVGKSYLGGPVPTPVNLSAGFHTYSLLWTKDRVTWYLDGVEKFTTTDHVPQQSMYFIANVADRIPDGDTSTSIASGDCNGTMQIQSVKVWQP